MYELLFVLALTAGFALLNRIRGGLFAETIKAGFRWVGPWAESAWRHFLDRASLPIVMGAALWPLFPGQEWAAGSLVASVALFMIFANKGQYQDMGTMPETRPAMTRFLVCWAPEGFWRDLVGLSVTGLITVSVPAAILASPWLMLAGLLRPIGYVLGYKLEIPGNVGEWGFGAVIGAGIALEYLW